MQLNKINSQPLISVDKQTSPLSKKEIEIKKIITQSEKIKRIITNNNHASLKSDI